MKKTLAYNYSQKIIKTNKNSENAALLYKIFITILMTIIAIILVFPYVFMVSKSLMSQDEVISAQIKFFPSVPQWSNYVKIFQDQGYGSALWNTLKVIIFNIIAIPISATFAAYGFARCEFKGKNILFGFMLMTMMLPGIITQIPLYVMYSKIGWTNTLYPLTIPNITGGGALYIFLARSFIQSLPKELDNAAKIDGATPLTRFFRINMPLCKPIIIYIMINVFIGCWGDYYGPLVWRVGDDFPATLAYKVFYLLQNGAVGNDTIHLRMAAGVFMSIIPAILFFIFQKQLIEGVAMEGLKG